MLITEQMAYTSHPWGHFTGRFKAIRKRKRSVEASFGSELCRGGGCEYRWSFEAHVLKFLERGVKGLFHWRECVCSFPFGYETK